MATAQNIVGAEINLLKSQIVKVDGDINAIHKKLLDDTLKNAFNHGYTYDSLKNKIILIHDATHGGQFNRNNRIYDSVSMMQEDYFSWFEPFPKPLLPIDAIKGSHNNESQAMGRIIYAKPFKVKDPSLNIGSMVIKTGSVVLDEDAIEQIKDGRYLSVSSSFRTKEGGKSLCSICYKDVGPWGCWEHIPGKLYTVEDDKNDKSSNIDFKRKNNIHDHVASYFNTTADNLGIVNGKSKLAFTFVTGLDYVHLSYVNAPAHANASNVYGFEITKKNESNNDSINIYDENKARLFLDKLCTHIPNDIFQDSKKNPNSIEDKMGYLALTFNDNNADGLIFDFSNKKSYSYSSENETHIDSQDLESVLKDIFDRDSDENDDLLTIADWFILDRVLDDEMGDAKLTTAKRNALKSSTFCGPDRSFPVPDCAHVVAAKRLIGRYKGPGDKSRILACVNRKGKALGCKTSDDSSCKDLDDNIDNVNEMSNHEDLKMNEKELKAFLDKYLAEKTKNDNDQNVDMIDQLNKTNLALKESNEALQKKLDASNKTLNTNSDLLNSLNAEVQAHRKMLMDNNKLTLLSLSYLTDENFRKSDTEIQKINNLTNDQVCDRLNSIIGKDHGDFFKKLNDKLKKVPTILIDKTVDNPSGTTVNTETLSNNNDNENSGLGINRFLSRKNS